MVDKKDCPCEYLGTIWKKLDLRFSTKNTTELPLCSVRTQVIGNSQPIFAKSNPFGEEVPAKEGKEEKSSRDDGGGD